MSRRETIERLVSKEKGLYGRLYRGHEIQTDVYAERSCVLDEIRKVSEDRIEFVLSVFDRMPHGEWCKPRCLGTNTFFQSLMRYRECKADRIKCEWAADEEIGFSYWCGMDGGYPETAGIVFPFEVLAEDDEEIVRVALLRQGAEEANATVSELEGRLIEAKIVEEKFHEQEK